MLSSRVTDPIELCGKASTLGVVRRAIKAELQAERLFEQQVFQVWINEDAPAAEGSVDAWEECLRQVTEADVVLVLADQPHDEPPVIWSTGAAQAAQPTAGRASPIGQSIPPWSADPCLRGWRASTRSLDYVRARR